MQSLQHDPIAGGDAPKIVARGTAKQDERPDYPPLEEDYGGGDIVSLELEPTTEDDQPLE